MSTEDRRINIAIDVALEFAALGSPSEGVIVGAEQRDDCAVISISNDTDLVIGSDFVRGSEFYLFQLGLLNYEDLGWYLAGANISDIAAMGATPSSIVMVARYDKDLTDDQWTQICSGFSACCRKYDVNLVGGDTGGYSTSVLSAAAIGFVKSGAALLRNAGQLGENIYVSDLVGRAGAAIAYFLRARPAGLRVSSALEQELLSSWKRVLPAVSQGQTLTKYDLSLCGIDTSDGLKAALQELSLRSGLGIQVDLKNFPIDHVVTRVAELMKLDPVSLSFSDSVDFRLVFSVPEEKYNELETRFSDAGWPLYRVGKFVAEQKGVDVFYINESGDQVELPGIPWEQTDYPIIDKLLEN
jgi:thiamine-monophosphate kinase